MFNEVKNLLRLREIDSRLKLVECPEVSHLHAFPDRVVLGGPEVAFYARNAEDVPDLQAELSDWADALPDGARWEPVR